MFKEQFLLTQYKNAILLANRHKQYCKKILQNDIWYFFLYSFIHLLKLGSYSVDWEKQVWTCQGNNPKCLYKCIKFERNQGLMYIWMFTLVYRKVCQRGHFLNINVFVQTKRSVHGSDYALLWHASWSRNIDPMAIERCTFKGCQHKKTLYNCIVQTKRSVHGSDDAL